MLRAWMQEPVAPAPDYDERPGRWVAEAGWPGRDEPPLAFVLDAEGLTAEPTGDAALVHTSPQTVGLDAGAWCAYGNPADIPVDQRRDDARSLTFDSAPVAERFEMLGQPIVTLRVSADRPRAFVAARLCDVAPDGASTVITRGFLNLCHPDDHEHARDVPVGEPFGVRIAMKSVAYAVPAGHTVRLALSTSYWPWLWPSPEPVALTVHTGGASTLELPVRTPHALDDALPPLGPPEIAPRLAVEILDPRPAAPRGDRGRRRGDDDVRDVATVRRRPALPQRPRVPRRRPDHVHDHRRGPAVADGRVPPPDRGRAAATRGRRGSRSSPR